MQTQIIDNNIPGLIRHVTENQTAVHLTSQAKNIPYINLFFLPKPIYSSLANVGNKQFFSKISFPVKTKQLSLAVHTHIYSNKRCSSGNSDVEVIHTNWDSDYRPWFFFFYDGNYYVHIF